MTMGPDYFEKRAEIAWRRMRKADVVIGICLLINLAAGVFALVCVLLGK